MSKKAILTGVMLGFVGLSLVLASMDVVGWRGAATIPAASDPAAASARYTAIFFHAPHRCPTCIKIEKYSHDALQPEIENGALVWQVKDYTTTDNATMINQMEVMTSTVVLAEQRNGKIVRWKNLEQVWDHTHDQSQFAAFMQDAWKEFQRESL